MQRGKGRKLEGEGNGRNVEIRDAEEKRGNVKSR